MSTIENYQPPMHLVELAKKLGVDIDEEVEVIKQSNLFRERIRLRGLLEQSMISQENGQIEEQHGVCMKRIVACVLVAIADFATSTRLYKSLESSKESILWVIFNDDEDASEESLLSARTLWWSKVRRLAQSRVAS